MFKQGYFNYSVRYFIEELNKVFRNFIENFSYTHEIGNKIDK